MEVHPPHHPITSWRDFFLHLATITVGLLIALGLEGTVEWMHHRTLVAEAKTNLRREITENRDAATKDLESVKQDMARMQSNLETERALRTHPKDFHSRLQFTFEWSSMSESAWNTARDTGALSYMDYDDVQTYADIYGQQKIVDDWALDVFREQTRAISPVYTEVDVSRLAPEEGQRLLDQTSTAYLDLTTLQQTLSQLRDQYIAELKKPLH